MADASHQDHNVARCHRQHFLVVAYGIQSHVNPAQHLARRLARIDSSILATLSVPVAAHRRMFPSAASADRETSDEAISYVPFSDGFDDGIKPTDAADRAHGLSTMFQSLSAIVSRLAAQGRPVTCIVSTMAMPSVLGVAREHGIPLAVYWTQPATVLAAYYHYFHGYSELIASHASDPDSEVSLPGLRPLRVRSLPSFVVDTTGSELSEMIVEAFRELFQYMDREQTKVLVSTFDGLEATALRAMQPYLQEVFAIGTMAGPPEARTHLFQLGNKGYTEWLGAQPERSVVYISFGSILTYSRQQMEEILQGMQECGRPYLWVVRKNGLEEEAENFLDDTMNHHQGMVVEWCDQLEVLSHPSVGCFVTHCGWNSTLEALAFGVPMVAAPNWSDQPTNAFLVEEEWGAGTRVNRNGEGVVAGEDLAKSVESVMGDCETAVEIREKANAMKETLRKVVAPGGPTEKSLQCFAKAMAASKEV
ncbi:crocetin glucosyltransferase, chloroplastic-like [Phragmites australis]|uniref:crocetin glucosyltransferase, chloroplastic-like n=1 Tax=Phragmites australis TaxID=29695 RepID=UPI002D770CA9|nr:crocetin glucosyltransferase, chloroplastic-like [Phragmites australis]